MCCTDATVCTLDVLLSALLLCCHHHSLADPSCKHKPSQPVCLSVWHIAICTVRCCSSTIASRFTCWSGFVLQARLKTLHGGVGDKVFKQSFRRRASLHKLLRSWLEVPLCRQKTVTTKTATTTAAGRALFRALRCFLSTHRCLISVNRLADPCFQTWARHRNRRHQSTTLYRLICIMMLC